jgi:hypothetical protein
VSVGFGDGAVRAVAVRTVTDPGVRFFAVVVPGGRTVTAVTPLDGSGAPLGQPDADPDTEPACAPAPDTACATPAG